MKIALAIVLFATTAWANPCDDPLWRTMANQCCPKSCPCIDPADIATKCANECAATCTNNCPPCPPATVELVQTVIPVGKRTKCKTKKGNPLLQVCIGKVIIKTAEE